MKLFIIALVALAAIASPALTFACPPPPAPGYDGPQAGTGPLPGADHHDGTMDNASNDNDNSSIPGDCTASEQVM